MKRLVDAKRKFVFEITPEDIANAKRKDKNFCVIACAVRENPGVLGVEIGVTTTRVTTEKATYRYATPARLAKALVVFDDTGLWKLPAGVYTLTPPTGWISLESIKEHNRNAPDRKRDGYEQTGRNKPRKVNPRVIEFAKLRNTGRPD